jgi:hypothetical protein
MTHTHFTTLCTLVYLYPSHLQTFRCYIRPEAIGCKQIKLLIISTLAGSWIEIQQTIICSLTEYVVSCAWSGLHTLSSFALYSLTLNFS